MEFNTFGKTFNISEMTQDGKKYIITNCDTGRNITEKESALFECRDGSFTINGKVYKIVPLKHNRYKLEGSDGFLCDTDEGGSPDACLGTEPKDSKTIECCWYLTEEGRKEPLRFMLLGDSITLGHCAELPETQMWGCRPEFTQLIGTVPGNRYVSVGSMKSENTTEDETMLLRHEGHGGWMAVDIYASYKRWEENRGLAAFIDDWQKKYRPELFFVMTGTNDCAFAAGRDQFHEAVWTDDVMTGVIDRWISLFDKIWNNNPDATVVIATCPPTTRSTCLNDWFIEFNGRVRKTVFEWKEAGKKVLLADNNYAIFNADQFEGLCSDKIHLSPSGYHAMAGEYFKAFQKVYPRGVIEE